MLDMKEYESVAMFRLSDNERKMLGNRADALYDSFNALEKIDVDGVEPLVSVLDICNVFREDIAKKLLTRDEIMANAPEQHDGYFQVPGTLG